MEEGIVSFGKLNFHKSLRGLIDGVKRCGYVHEAFFSRERESVVMGVKERWRSEVIIGG